MLHVHRPHVPHPHVHPEFDDHPWRMVPVTLAAIVLLGALLMVATSAIAKAVTGHAY